MVILLTTTKLKPPVLLTDGQLSIKLLLAFAFAIIPGS
jgi:hypothetical protein